MRIVADTSAFTAILLREDDAHLYRQHLLNADRVLISAATAVELHIVVSTRLGAEGVLLLNELLQEPLFEQCAITAEHTRLARSAFDRYGKGRHPAALNFGDIFAYALARSTNLPLLYKGRDFAQTDIRSALSA